MVIFSFVTIPYIYTKVQMQIRIFTYQIKKIAVSNQTKQEYQT